tara:strand:- start:317 stop:676 length:360 start_codon:yes stop_codon:yes gene_type:complete
MGTRCNIKVTDGHDTLWFYRHWDGYPSSVMPSLEPLMEGLKSGNLRANVGQFAGWITVIGHQEAECPELGSGWKCGNYEPTTGEHGDIEYLYTIDLRNKTLDCLDYREAKRGMFEKITC